MSRTREPSWYATVRRFLANGRTGDDLIPQGRRLAIAVSKERGFIAYVLLEAENGTVISMSVFEEQAGLAHADALVERWGAAHGLTLLPGMSGPAEGR